MPVTAGPVPGLTSGLRRVPTDPGRFRTGRWWLLAEGVLVSAFGVAGLLSAALHPHAGPTGVPVLGLASAPAHSAILLALGVLAIAAVAKRRAAVAVTALSAVGYTLLLFFSSVATARTTPTPLGFHAADIVLHGVLAVVNLALLLWLIPDELGDEAWVPRRGRDRDQPQSAAAGAVPEREAASPSAASPTVPPEPEMGTLDSNPGPTIPPPDVASPSQKISESTPLGHSATRRSKGVTPAVLVMVVLVVGIIIWMRRR